MKKLLVLLVATLLTTSAFAVPIILGISIRIPAHNFHNGRSNCHSGFGWCNIETHGNLVVNNNGDPDSYVSIDAEDIATCYGSIFSDESDNLFVTLTIPSGLASYADFYTEPFTTFELDEPHIIYTDASGVTYTAEAGSYSVSKDKAGNFTTTIPVTAL